MFQFEMDFVEFLQERGLEARSAAARAAQQEVLAARDKLSEAIGTVADRKSESGLLFASLDVVLASVALNDKKMRFLAVLLSEASSSPRS